MKSVTREQWVAALRSGKYEQTMGRLYRPGEGGSCGFCCLGVLADLAGAERSNLCGGAMILDGEDGFSIIHPQAADMVGLSFRLQESLMGMNDTGKTFAEIADYIETMPFESNKE